MSVCCLFSLHLFIRLSSMYPFCTCHCIYTYLPPPSPLCPSLSHTFKYTHISVNTEVAQVAANWLYGWVYSVNKRQEKRCFHEDMVKLCEVAWHSYTDKANPTGSVKFSALSYLRATKHGWAVLIVSIQQENKPWQIYIRQSFFLFLLLTLRPHTALVNYIML